jgi:hypothetical protein
VEVTPSTWETAVSLSLSPQPGWCKIAPFLPQQSHRAELRSQSLDASGSQLIINGVRATGVRFRQFAFSQISHHQGADWRS